MRRIAVVVALLSLITLAHVGTVRAQTLYKCASAKGNIYQQIPCPRSARLVRTMETVPEPPLTATQLAEQALKAKRDREESAFLSQLAGTDRVRSNYRSGYRSTNARSSGNRFTGERYSSHTRVQRDTQDACAAAKGRRDNAIRSAGLKRTFDLLRQLDADVSDACTRG
jgi:hypothetical protein